MSLKFKILSITMTAFLFTVGLTSTLNILSFGKDYREAVKEKYFILAENMFYILNTSIKMGIKIEQLGEMNSYCEDVIKRFSDISYAMVLNPDGKVLIHNSSQEVGKVLQEPSLQASFKSKDHMSTERSLGGQTFYNLSIPIIDAQGNLGGSIHIGLKKAAINNLIRSRMLVSMGLAGISLLLAGIILFYLLSRWLQPFHRIISVLSDGALGVASASEQINLSSQQLAEGASEQAGSLEETSSSLEEMASMTRQNAENAQQANELTQGGAEFMKKARHSMKTLIQAIEEISKASEDTTKIIRAIDEITFQTNLLALNAAVEAARAGEAGAGFAVVADEVRNLALRAAEAAKNTSLLIEGIVKKVHEGSELVHQTDGFYREAASALKKVVDLMGQIAAASQEQAQGIEQVNKAVSEMDKVVQKNAASAEESASAAEEMNAQAEVMKEFVGELIASVGGQDGNGVLTNTEFGRYDRPYRDRLRNVGSKFAGAIHESPLQSSEPKKPVGNGKRQVSQFINKVTDGVKKKEMKPPLQKAREVHPDQVIPMEDSDFKEF